MRNLALCCWLVVLVCTYPTRGGCAYNIPGDVNSDCQVNFMDLAIIIADWQVEGPTEPNQLWVATYDGPTHNSDGATALTTDDRGNIYVTGESVGAGGERDYATIKYDSDGNQVWLARYDGDANKSDTAAAIILDDAGNVYVTGWSEGSGTSSDYATIKYDASGNRAWVARYNADTNGCDEATAIAVDDSCNVYVTGYSSYSAGAGYDYVTIKYDSDGNQVWLARYDSDANDADYAYALVIDDVCNVYVTGCSYASDTCFDYTTIKYDANGNRLWAAGYNGPGGGCDVGHAIAIDDACNVYVTGYTYYGSDANYFDYATIKYDPNGNVVWERLYDGQANRDDEARDIALDRAGGVYVTGCSWVTSTDCDYVTVKYDGDGNEVWVARYDGPAHSRDEPAALAIRDPNCIYVTGYSEGGASSGDYTTVKYDGDGNEVWVGRYNGPGNDWDDASAMVLDRLGNIYVAGCSDSLGPNRDYATIKYSPNGNCLAQITGDVNADCTVDLQDMAIIADHWLECSLDPPEECPQ